MRYGKGHKDETRKRILDVAAKRFRKDGVDAVGVAGLMADAGLTHGGFYSHFPSKEHLVREVLDTVLETRHASLERSAASGKGIEPVIERYLSVRHRDEPENGCPFACFAVEIARHEPETREMFTAKFNRHVELIAAHLPEGSEEQRRQRATALLGLMSGMLQLARATPSPETSDDILASARQHALAMAVAPYA
ncbi:MAG: hypothetical protein BGP04_21315 [Rhizobiales bacterium 62-17]|nr:TetR/AcrR family transcriptional regulator [Hyphomicrobiales bacterium]OJY00152.1 MAG: hypothetical protein BGP04_21315 [Rhizobiales bacterium 62-17]